jgi:arginase family enzyme
MSHVSDLIGDGRLIQLRVAPCATVEQGSEQTALAYQARVGSQISDTGPELVDEARPAALAGAGRDVYLTIDVDVLDRAWMSATGYPADIGLTPAQLLRLIDIVLKGNTLIGCDVVEFAARRDDRDPKTLADGGRAVTILLHLLRHLSTRGNDRP